LAFAHMLLMCLLHFRSDVMVTPKYLADVTCSSICLCTCVYMYTAFNE
jgi:hypothetical protein